MPYRDLREYIAKLEELGELARVSKEVDPKYELGAICNAAHDRGRKAVAAENFLDNSFLQQLESSGYIKSLYPR
jgi:UbiD family decarboxylase